MVIDASAGVELLADTARGKALRPLIPAGAALVVPEHFYTEVASVLRRWEFRAVLTAAQAHRAIRDLVDWPLRRTALSSLLPGAWRHRHNFTISDAMYVVLADQLGASLLTDDRRLAGSPTLPPGLQLLTLPI